MEASALQAPAGVARSRISIGAPLLRLRSDEQLVSLFRAGNEDAFRVIHDRYRQRLFAYARQMLPGSRQDAEDALQDVFVRAYSALRASDRDVALRAWLYRIAHNRCIDELRRPPVPVPELIEMVRSPIPDPIAEAEQRESLRRLIADIRRLPEQQRSVLLMRELSGMSYSELAIALGISIPAVKSLLVRARVGLAQAAEARETSCSTIRDELIAAHDRRQRPNATARRHLRDCPACCDFRSEMRSVSHQLAALAPTLGPLGVLAKVLGLGGGGSAAAGGGAVAAGGAAAGGVLASGAAGHVATILAAAVVTAGGAVEIQHSISAPTRHHPRHHVRPAIRPAPRQSSATPAPSEVVIDTSSISAAVRAVEPPAPVAPPQRQVASATKQAVVKAPRDGALGGFTVPPTSGGSAPTDANAGASAGAATGTGSSATTPTTGSTNAGTTDGTPGSASATTTGGTSSATGPATSTPGGTSGTKTGGSDTSGSSTSPTSPGGTSTTGSTASASTSSVGTSTGSVGLSH